MGWNKKNTEIQRMGYIALACDDRLNSHNKMLKEQLVEDLQDDLNERRDKLSWRSNKLCCNQVTRLRTVRRAMLTVDQMKMILTLHKTHSSTTI